MNLALSPRVIPIARLSISGSEIYIRIFALSGESLASGPSSPLLCRFFTPLPRPRNRNNNYPSGTSREITRSSVIRAQDDALKVNGIN